MKICEQGIPKCAIYLPERPTQVESHSARELKKYLRKMSGADFRIVHGMPDTGPAIIVAEIAHTPLAGERQMAGESILRKVDDGRLFLVGADPRGTLIGVYAFLRDQLGCLFPQPRASNEYIPQIATIDVAEETYYHEPFLPQRYIIQYGSRDIVDWAAKTGMSYAGTPSLQECNPVTVRGEPGITIFSHACESIMPPSRYFDAHPEYFAYNPTQQSNARHTVKDGRDSYGICWTHPEVNRIFLEYFLDLFARNPHVTRYTFFPNDAQPPCYCDTCQQVEIPWQGINNATPQYTKNYLLFAARIAREVAKQFPSVRLEVGSYGCHADVPDDFTEELPDNLDVLFCIIERKWDRALDDPPTDEELHRTLAQTTVSSYEKDAWRYTRYQDVFAQWRRHVKGQLRYYDYLTSTFASCGMPFPVSRAACRTICYLKAQGFSGYASQWRDSPLIRASYGLSLYVTGRKMWDGNAEWDDLAREYCRGYFMSAAEPMVRYFTTLENAAHQVRFGIGIPELLQVFDRQTCDTCRQFLREASLTAVSAKVKRRIREQKILLEFGYLFWLTRQLELQLEKALNEDRLDDTYGLLAKHLKIDDRIQRLSDCRLLRWGKENRGLLHRHLMGSGADHRGILYAVKGMKNAVNARNQFLWYGEDERF